MSFSDFWQRAYLYQWTESIRFGDNVMRTRFWVIYIFGRNVDYFINKYKILSQILYVYLRIVDFTMYR